MTIKRIIDGKEVEITLTHFEEFMIFKKVSAEQMERVCDQYREEGESKYWD